jgi:hypothetical protein
MFSHFGTRIHNRPSHLSPRRHPVVPNVIGVAPPLVHHDAMTGLDDTMQPRWQNITMPRGYDTAMQDTTRHTKSSSSRRQDFLRLQHRDARPHDTMTRFTSAEGTSSRCQCYLAAPQISTICVYVCRFELIMKSSAAHPRYP